MPTLGPMPESDAPVDPEEFLRALLKISPEDAAKAREEAAKAGTTATPKPDAGRDADRP